MKVYDVTSVLDWHPGGKAAVLGHAGKMHQKTSDEFASIHDGYAYQKLDGMISTLRAVHLPEVKLDRMHTWRHNTQSSDVHQKWCRGRRTRASLFEARP